MDIGALRLSSQFLHALYELDDVDHAIHIPIEQSEHPVRILQVDREGLHEFPHLIPTQAGQEFLPRNVAVTLGVHVAQQLDQVLRGGLPLLPLLSNHHAPVPLAKLDRTIDEDTGDDIQNREQIDEDVERDDTGVHEPRRLDEVGNLSPVAAAGHRLKERIHGLQDGPVCIHDRALLSGRQPCTVHVHGGALCKNQGEAIA
mmetsp:Transcript_121086/g.349852  ORF Transcript_121086/g.349852 Transcript_121086/m.349852 type:complete len:201 (-) Transcript_121086:1272-1874(-)